MWHNTLRPDNSPSLVGDPTAVNIVTDILRISSDMTNDNKLAHAQWYNITMYCLNKEFIRTPWLTY